MAWTETETAIMRDIFLLMKRNAGPDTTEAYWTGLAAQTGQICAKYGGHKLAVDMCAAAYQYYADMVERDVEK